MFPFSFVLPSFLNKQFLILCSVSLLIIGALGLYIYVNHLRNEVDSLTTENSQLKVAVQEQQKTIDTLKKDYEQIIKKKDEYNQKVKELEKKNKALKDDLFRETLGKKSLEDEALGKDRDLIEKHINDITRKSLRCLESATGNQKIVRVFYENNGRKIFKPR